jgi:hypothetical protein
MFKTLTERRSSMNPYTGEIGNFDEPGPGPSEKANWRRFDIGQTVYIGDCAFEVLAIDVAKQTIKLKGRPNPDSPSTPPASQPA